MRGEAKRRSDWNYNLLEEVVAPAYCETILQIAKDIAENTKEGNLEDYYSIWPHWQDANRDNAWGFLTRKFYDQIGDHAAFSMELKLGLRFRTLQIPTVIITSEERKAYPDLEDLLLNAGVQLTAPPKAIVDSLAKFEKTFYLLRPGFARKLAKSQPVVATATPPVQNYYSFLFVFNIDTICFRFLHNFSNFACLILARALVLLRYWMSLTVSQLSRS